MEDPGLLQKVLKNSERVSSWQSSQVHCIPDFQCQVCISILCRAYERPPKVTKHFRPDITAKKRRKFRRKRVIYSLVSCGPWPLPIAGRATLALGCHVVWEVHAQEGCSIPGIKNQSLSECARESQSLTVRFRRQLTLMALAIFLSRQKGFPNCGTRLSG
jgi:hypothetical protein